MTPKQRENEPVAVATAPNQAIGAMWVELLRGEGVMATLKCTDVLSVAYLVPSPYPCDIVVPASQAERAREILDSLADQDSADETNEETNEEPNADGDS